MFPGGIPVLFGPQEVNASQYYQSIRADRELWRAEQKQECMNCESKHDLQIHEMERRSHAARRWGCRSNYLLVCGDCHAGPFASLSHASQLALKQLKDPEHYDLENWLRIADPTLRAPQRVTQQEVNCHLAL